MPTEQRWREGFFYNWPFPLGPRLTGWEEETGGQRSACSLPPTHTHKLPKQRKQTEECLGPGWFGNLDKPSPSSCFRHIFFTDVSVTPKQDTLKQNTSQCTTHSQRCRRKRCSLAHANIRAGWRQALQFSVGSRVLHKTSVTLIHHGEWCMVCANHPGKPRSLGLQTPQSCCLIVYSAISGILVFFPCLRKLRTWESCWQRFIVSEVHENWMLVLLVLCWVFFCYVRDKDHAPNI